MTTRSEEGRPRILCLFPLWPWPASSGGRARAAAIVEALRTDHEVIVLAADRCDSGYAAWDGAVRRVLGRRASRFARLQDILEGALMGDHTAARRASRAHLPDAFGQILDELRPEVVLLGRPFFGEFLREARRRGAKTIIDADERLTNLSKSVVRAAHMPIGARLRAGLEMLTLGRMERREYPQADLVWVASQTERTNFLSLVDAGRLRIVPNPSPSSSDDRADHPVRSVAYVGWYGHAPNEAAALELIADVMPAIRMAGGPRRLVLIGRDPTTRMRRAARRMADLVITGEVEDVQPLLREAGLLVLPIRAGGGTRIKVLEAAMAGVPIVSTRLGVEGLDFEPDRHYLVAEAPSQFATQVVRLTADATLRARVVREAREMVTERHSPSAVIAAVRVALSHEVPSSRSAVNR